MSTNKQMIDLAIIQYSSQYSELPELSKIEEMTGLQAITIMRNLDCDYPKELIVSKIERTVLDAYSENQSPTDLSRLLDMGYYEVANAISRLRKKGLIERNFKRMAEDHGDTIPAYIEIIADVFFKLSETQTINIKGFRGYIDGTSTKVKRAIVYINKRPWAVNISEKETKRIGGKRK